MAAWSTVRKLTSSDDATINEYDDKGKTQLLRACEAGKSDVCRLLLLSKASPDLATSEGQTPLFLACRTGSAECAHMLILSRSDVGASTKAGFTSLFIASQKGSIDCISVLLSAKADVNQASLAIPAPHPSTAPPAAPVDAPPACRPPRTAARRCTWPPRWASLPQYTC